MAAAHIEVMKTTPISLSILNLIINNVLSYCLVLLLRKLSARIPISRLIIIIERLFFLSDGYTLSLSSSFPHCLSLSAFSIPVAVNWTSVQEWAEVIDCNYAGTHRVRDLAALKHFILRGLWLTVEEQKV